LRLFLFVKDVDSVLYLYKPCPLSVDVLPSSFSTLSNCLPPHDGFLFLTEPLHFLLDLDQLFFIFYSFVFISFFILVLHLNLIKLSAALNGLYQRRCPQG
jgi:hypothetical protein